MVRKTRRGSRGGKRHKGSSKSPAKPQAPTESTKARLSQHPHCCEICLAYQSDASLRGFRLDRLAFPRLKPDADEPEFRLCTQCIGVIADAD